MATNIKKDSMANGDLEGASQNQGISLVLIVGWLVLTFCGSVAKNYKIQKKFDLFSGFLFFFSFCLEKSLLSCGEEFIYLFFFYTI